MAIRLKWLALTAGIVLCAGSASAALRFPMPDDIARCVKASARGQQFRTGAIRLQLMIRPDGTIYAAYAQSQHGLDERPLERCITNQALIWTFEPGPIAYERPYVVQFQSSTVYLPNPNKIPPPEPLDVDLAQGTLDLSETATNAEKGAAYVDVHDYQKAIPLLRGAQDPGSLASLARALAESGGDLKEARATAEKAVAAAPSSSIGHEALLRVCMAAEDRVCMADEWKATTSSPDFAPRTLVVKEQLEEPVRNAVCLLNAEREGKSPKTCEKLALQLQPQAQPQDTSAFQTTAEAEGKRRDTRWTVLGGYGFAGLGVGIGAVMGESFSRQQNRTGNYSDHSKAYRGAAIGALVGLVPGLVFGNAARDDDNEQGRVVTILTDVAGTLAIAAAYGLVTSRD